MFPRTISALTIPGAVLMAMAMSCGKGSHDAETGADESSSTGEPPPPPPCLDCPCCDGVSEDLYQCGCYITGTSEPQDSGMEPICTDKASLAFSIYASLCGTNCGEAYPLNFDGADIFEAHCPDARTSSCVNWDPDSEVTLTSGVYHLDADFVESLIDRYELVPLWACDDTTVEGLSAGGFDILDADAGELLYELGLRDFDTPMSINGMPLDDYNDAFLAFGSLYLLGEDDYNLVVHRGSTNITLQYHLDP